MNKLALMLGMVGVLFACSKEELVSPDLACSVEEGVSQNLLGKWEAAYSVRSNGETYFYQEGTDFPCAYIVLPFEYNSGFEITDDRTGELLWCGRNKEQFFTWSYGDNVMKVNFNNVAYEVSVQNVTTTSMQLTVDGEVFFMRKY